MSISSVSSNAASWYAQIAANAGANASTNGVSSSSLSTLFDGLDDADSSTQSQPPQGAAQSPAGSMSDLQANGLSSGSLSSLLQVLGDPSGAAGTTQTASADDTGTSGVSSRPHGMGGHHHHGGGGASSLTDSDDSADATSSTSTLADDGIDSEDILTGSTVGGSSATAAPSLQLQGATNAYSAAFSAVGAQQQPLSSLLLSA